MIHHTRQCTLASPTGSEKEINAGCVCYAMAIGIGGLVHASVGMLCVGDARVGKGKRARKGLGERAHHERGLCADCVRVVCGLCADCVRVAG